MEKILVLDFGGQYNLLIARRVREQHVYAEVKSYRNVTAESVAAEGYKGIIFTGGPNSVYDEKSPKFDKKILTLGLPILGICYGAQLLAWLCGGKVASAEESGEYGKVTFTHTDDALFDGVPSESVCWMSHTDSICELPQGFAATAYTGHCPVAAMSNGKNLYAVQFHPEVTHTEYGKKILANFIFAVCGCKGDWDMTDFARSSIEKYRAELKGKKALCALSGGVDSSVAAVLMHKAIGSDLTCVFVDHGLLRKDEGDSVEHTFRGLFDMKLVRVNAANEFLDKLKGVTEPERKRKIIGEEFIRVFEREARKIGKVDYLVQGTIYPDVVESGAGDAGTIKSHHNVGGLPDVVDFDGIAEPLRYLFKDEVRAVGRALGIPDELVDRQPFPGPGLAIRIVGEVNEEKLSILREADAIFREEITSAGLAENPDQYFAVLTDCRTVGIKGDARTYGYTLALRAVSTDDFMTADWTRIPYELIARASNRITNEVRGISRVVYDVTSKPPATVEWE